MAISYPVSVPSVGGIREIRFRMLDAVGVSESPYTFAQETYEHAGKRWAIDVQLAPMERADAEEWIAFLASLQGRNKTFLLGDPVGASPRGSIAGSPSPVVNGNSQTGQVLNIKLCPPSVANYLRKGDWIQLGSGASAHLHKCLSDVTTTGAGLAALDLWPGPRVGAAPADGDPITTDNTQGVWRLAANERGWDVSVAPVFGLSFSAVEAL